MQMFAFPDAKLLVCALTASVGNGIRSFLLNPTSNIRFSFKTPISADLGQTHLLQMKDPREALFHCQI